MAVTRREALKDFGIEFDGSCRIDRIHPVLLVDRLAQNIAPAPFAPFDEIAEAAGADHVDKHAVHRRALGDRHLGLADRAVAVQVDRGAAEKMQDADPALPARLVHGDEFVAGALGPGRHHHTVRVPDGAEALPVAGVAPDCPVLDQVAQGEPVQGFCVHNKLHRQSGGKRTDSRDRKSAAPR